MRPVENPSPPAPLLAAAVLVVAALVAYHGSFAVPFFFDDHSAITHNTSIREWWRLDRVLLPPSEGAGMAGRPIVNASLAFNYALGGTQPRGYHAFNLALHALNALLLFGLARRTLLSPPLRPSFGQAAAPLAGIIALLWTVHPLQTESVTCVIQRTELLVGFFYLLTLYAFVRAAAAPGARGWPGLALAACALGMASKEVMVSAPVLVFLYDRTFLAGSFREAWRRRGRLHLGLAATWLVLAALLWQMGGTRGAAAGFGLGVTWWSYAFKQCEAIVTYLALAVWPHPLVIDYGTDVITDPGRVAPQIAAIGALALGTFGAMRWRPVAGFLGFWFCALLAPSSSVVPLITQTAAEHRMYLPLAAVIALAVAGAHRVYGRTGYVVAGLLAAALTAGTIARNRLLQDELALWADTVVRVPANPRAHASLGLALSDRGRAAEALPHFQRALALDPRDVATEQNLGHAHFKLGQLAEAEACFRRAIALNPAFASGHNNLGATLLERRDFAGALAAFASALRLEPDHTGAHQNTARALFALGRFAEAVPHYERVQQARPDAPDAHYDLGLALARAGDIDRATRHFSTALRLRPSPGSHLNFARFLAQAGRTSDAIANLEQALRLQPNFTAARVELERLRALPP
ncbi:MAG: tetratricopeptide repeat protein [Opitutaceae bacterium]|nr:tetratricopeptide repeat protein [Opitutaceae bacterium]